MLGDRHFFHGCREDLSRKPNFMNLFREWLDSDDRWITLATEPGDFFGKVEPYQQAYSIREVPAPPPKLFLATNIIVPKFTVSGIYPPPHPISIECKEMI